jgi:hypothetical protein
MGVTAGRMAGTFAFMLLVVFQSCSFVGFSSCCNISWWYMDETSNGSMHAGDFFSFGSSDPVVLKKKIENHIYESQNKL